MPTDNNQSDTTKIVYEMKMAATITKAVEDASKDPSGFFRDPDPLDLLGNNHHHIEKSTATKKTSKIGTPRWGDCL